MVELQAKSEKLHKPTFSIKHIVKAIFHCLLNASSSKASVLKIIFVY